MNMNFSSTKTACAITDSVLFDGLGFLRGPNMKNRFMLAPLTNLQSHSDGRLSDDEFNWLTRPASRQVSISC